MKNRQKLQYVALAIIFFPLLHVSLLKAENINSLPDPIAIVNGKGISHDAYDRELKQTRKQLLKQGKLVTESQLSEIKKVVLDDMIDRELLYQKSRKIGISVSIDDVEKQYASVKNSFPEDIQFKNALVTMGFNEESFKKQIEESLARQRLINKVITPEISITETQSQAFYDSNPQFFKKPERIRASHILIKTDVKSEEAQTLSAKKRIEMIQQKLSDGEDFTVLAKAFSECPSAAKGGDLGYFERGQMVKPFEEVAFALAVDEVSDIVQTQFGFHLIKLSDRQPASVYPYDEVQDAIIRDLKRRQTQKEVKLYVEKLRANANIRVFFR